jgi:hypothetical protein
MRGEKGRLAAWAAVATIIATVLAGLTYFNIKPDDNIESRPLPSGTTTRHRSLATTSSDRRPRSSPSISPSAHSDLQSSRNTVRAAPGSTSTPTQRRPMAATTTTNSISHAQTRRAIDVEAYCWSGWRMHAVVRYDNAYGWRCSQDNTAQNGEQQGDQNVSMDDACQQQYGSRYRSAYRDYADPYSWYCHGS